MSSRIARKFEQLAASGRKALMPYITSGFPTRDVTVPVMHAMVAAGADIIELGVPFSDPMADGPVVQHANEVALANKVSLRDVLAYVAEFRRQDNDTPIVLMGYANPVERMGVDAFLKASAEAGVDGLIVVDYPPEESQAFNEAARALGLDLIFLLAPTSTAERVENVRQMARGFIYYVSLTGVTGGTMRAEQVIERVGQLKQAIPLPICVGFGVRDATTARSVGAVADGVIIGSRMIQIMEEGGAEGAASRAGVFIAEIRQALDSIGAGR